MNNVRVLEPLVRQRALSCRDTHVLHPLAVDDSHVRLFELYPCLPPSVHRFATPLNAGTAYGDTPKRQTIARLAALLSALVVSAFERS